MKDRKVNATAAKDQPTQGSAVAVSADLDPLDTSAHMPGLLSSTFCSLLSLQP